VTRLLRTAKYEVRGYASASEFVDSNPCADPGCILLDLRMPGASALDRSAAQHRGAEARPPGTNAAGPNPFGSHFDRRSAASPRR